MEEKVKVEKHFTKFIYPFYFDSQSTNLESATVEGRNGQLQVFTLFSQNSELLRSGIEGLMTSAGGSSRACMCYKLNNAVRSRFSLPRRESEVIKLHMRSDKDDEGHGVRITDVNVYLFESEVGFVEAEAEFVTEKLEELIDCNYFISELKSDKNFFTFENRTKSGKDSPEIIETVKFSLTGLYKSVLQYIGKVREIGNDREPSFDNDKAIIYSYVLLNKKPEDTKALLFNLRENYKESYKPPVGVADKHVLNQFENSYFGASYNGAVNLSYLVDDETTNNFFRENFYAALHNTYFSLFLNALHQRYALMKFIADMGKLDHFEKDYDQIKLQLKLAKSYQAKIANLKFRDFFLMPSLIEHINNYFDLLYRTFEIAELEKSLNTDLASLKNICETYVNRIDERDRIMAARKKSKIGILISVFGVVVGIMELIDSYWSVIEKAFGKYVSFVSPQIILFVCLLMVPIATIIFEVVNEVKDIRKKTKSVRADEENNLIDEKHMYFKKKNKKKTQSKN